MSFETALAARLLDDEGYADTMGSRVDWMRRPGDELPATTLQVVSDPRPQHYTGFQKVRQTRVQADVWASSPGAAVDAREALIAILAPPATSQGVRFQRAVIANVRPGFEQEEAGGAQQSGGELYRESIDFIFTHDA